MKNLIIRSYYGCVLKNFNNLYPYFRTPFKIVFLNMALHLLFMHAFLDCQKLLSAHVNTFVFNSIFTHASHVQTRLVGCSEVSGVGKQCMENLETLNCVLKLLNALLCDRMEIVLPVWAEVTSKPTVRTPSCLTELSENIMNVTICHFEKYKVLNK